MRILAIESSARAASAAVYQDGELTAECFQNCGLTHSRTLVPMLEDMLKNCNLAIKDMDRIAVARGPGSFTGIRIGVAVAKGLAWGSKIPCCGVSTLEAMAWRISYARPDEVICAVMDARRKEVYNALFKFDGEPVRLCDDRALSIDMLVSEVKKTGKSYKMVGDGAKQCYNVFLENGIKASLAPPHLLFQSAWGVACASVKTEARAPESLKPVYLRLSQAERERNSRKKVD